MTVWLLDTDDERTLDLSAQVGEEDIVVRHRDGEYEVGRAHPDADEPVTWYGEVDQHLVPATDTLEAREDRTPLQRLDDVPELEEAVQRLEEAEQLRGG